MIARRTGPQRFFALLGFSSVASAAWLLVPFAIGLALLPFEDALMLSGGWRETVYEVLFNGAWILGFAGVFVMPALTIFAGVKLGAPGRAIPLAVVFSVLAYGALSVLAILGLAEFYFPGAAFGAD